MTVQDTLETAGPEVLGLIERGRAKLKLAAQKEREREAQRLAEGERVADLHWLTLKKAVELIVPECLWPCCNTHREVMPDGLALWQTWDGGCWEACHDFTLKISAPGCAEVAASLHYTSEESGTGWNLARKKVNNHEFGMWLVRLHDFGRDDDGVYSVHEDFGRDPLHSNELNVALAYAAEEYKARNGLYLKCQEKNRAREAFKELKAAAPKPKVRTTGEWVLEALEAFVRENSPCDLREE